MLLSKRHYERGVEKLLIGSSNLQSLLSSQPLKNIMTPEQIIIVQTTFSYVLPFADETADSFYHHLFHLEPSLRPMFKRDMDSQRRKLISSLVLVIKNLQRPEVFLLKVQNLGRTHVDYGVQSHHYDLVGKALLYAIEQRLGADFTAEVEAAWVAAYTLLANVMKTAAYEPRRSEAVPMSA